jgi:hypothetical protein
MKATPAMESSVRHFMVAIASLRTPHPPMRFRRAASLSPKRERAARQAREAYGFGATCPQRPQVRWAGER